LISQGKIFILEQLQLTLQLSSLKLMIAMSVIIVMIRLSLSITTFYVLIWKIINQTMTLLLTLEHSFVSLSYHIQHLVETLFEKLSVVFPLFNYLGQLMFLLCELLHHLIINFLFSCWLCYRLSFLFQNSLSYS